MNFGELDIWLHVSMLDTVKEDEYFCVRESLILIEEFGFSLRSDLFF